MSDPSREDIQNMVNLAIAKYHAENLQTLNKLERKIDEAAETSHENGCKIDSLACDLKEAKGVFHKFQETFNDFLNSRESWTFNKKAVWGAFGAVSLVALEVIAKYVEHVVGW